MFSLQIVVVVPKEKYAIPITHIVSPSGLCFVYMHVKVIVVKTQIVLYG